jgi:hypothetical protein
MNYQAPELRGLLSYRRAHNSEGEKEYIRKFIMPLSPTIIQGPANEVMAFIVYVGKSDIMFTSHTDTVHMNSNIIQQEVVFKDGLYCKTDNQPLGADDAAGNWLMFHMIQARIPGIYAFFRGEERGGIGSSYCAKNVPDLFKGVQAAIALDRKGYKSVITHQGMGRGCSDEFGISLGEILGMGHVLDDTGIYTDTAEFFHLVPNCTNLSVGYENEHSKKETLNILYINTLKDRLIDSDWSKLDFTPPRPDPLDYGYSSRYSLFGSKVGDILPAPSLDVGPLQYADFMFDYVECLPPKLRDDALKLAQRIYKKYE